MSRGGTVGDGDPCPVEGHGRMIFTKDRKSQWCPHQSHDRSGIPAHYQYDGKTPKVRS